jgi:ubiquinone/menaquinone biosynthesis C-methylase UbiE
MSNNPWLDIPLADYEAHMALPTVGQSQLIADELAALVRRYSPTSVAVIGCAGGNGFDRLIDTSVTRVVGVDINPAYIEQARRRYSGEIPGLEVYVADLESTEVIFEPVDLAYVALVFEYVDLERAMRVLQRHCKPGSVLAVLSQLSHDTLAHVTPSPYTSLLQLEPRMRLVAPEVLQEFARQAGFAPERSRTVAATGGKNFSVLEFRLLEAGG